MNPKFQIINDLVINTAGLSDAEKEWLLKAIKDADKTQTMTEFKLERLEKDRYTLSVMLEESIEDLQKKSAAIEESNRTLTQTLNDLKAAQAQLIQSEKMASLGELTAGIAHEIQNPLNFVNNFSDVSTELVDEMNTEIDKGNLEDAKQIAQDLKQNLEKINHHGKRAGDIVKGMLQHSRTSSGQKELTDINALADEYLRLAYHGLRAKDKTFNAATKTDYDDTIGLINIIPQDIGRVILNLITNAFYAAPLPPEEGFKDPDYIHIPTIWLSTKKVGDKVLISVRDNGPGIPQKILDKIFQPFFTTKPTGQGTGLGLSLSYDIVKAHGGELTVKTLKNPPSGGRGAGIEIKVADNGNGIPQKVLDKIFQPFFTTKPTGQGTGLGLSLSYDIVKAHGGKLKVETKEGEGAEFVIQLPI